MSKSRVRRMLNFVQWKFIHTTESCDLFFSFRLILHHNTIQFQCEIGYSALTPHLNCTLSLSTVCCWQSISIRCFWYLNQQSSSIRSIENCLYLILCGIPRNYLFNVHSRFYGSFFQHNCTTKASMSTCV